MRRALEAARFQDRHEMSGSKIPRSSRSFFAPMRSCTTEPYLPGSCKISRFAALPTTLMMTPGMARFHQRVERPAHVDVAEDLEIPGRAPCRLVDVEQLAPGMAPALFTRMSMSGNSMASRVTFALSERSAGTVCQRNGLHAPVILHSWDTAKLSINTAKPSTA
jgi:hypothetical protein